MDNQRTDERREPAFILTCFVLIFLAFFASDAGAVTALTSSFSWSPVEPPAIGGEVPNFAGNMLGSALANVTGRVTAVAPDPRVQGQIFVGTANGGLWKITGAPTNPAFTPIADNLPHPTLAIGAIALDPSTNPTTIYVATGEGNTSFDSYYGQGLYKSTNLGLTWTAVGSFAKSSFTSLALNAANIYAGVIYGYSASRADAPMLESNVANDGLWHSNDGGSTWSQYPSATFALGGSPCFLTVLGVTGPCPATSIAIDAANPSQIYVGIYGDDVFRSTDAGVSWSPAGFPGGFPSQIGQVGRESVAIGPPASGAPSKCSNNTKQCGIVYAMVGASDNNHYQGLYMSIDGGQNWITQTVPSKALTNPPVVIDGILSSNYSQSAYDQALVVSASNSSAVFFGGVGIYESTDAGVTWNFLASSGGTHADQHALAFDPFSSTTVYVGNDGGFYSFDTPTSTFTALNYNSSNRQNLSADQFQGVDASYLPFGNPLAGLQDNGTVLWEVPTGSLACPQSSLGGLCSVDTGDGGVSLYDKVNPNLAYHTYATTPGGVAIAASTDGGYTWNWMAPTASIETTMNGDPGAAFYPPLAVDPGVSKRVLVGGHFVYVSTDGMNTWQQQETADLTGGCAADPTSLVSPCAIQDIEFAPSDHTKAYAISMQTTVTSPTTPFEVYKTTQANLNSGVTWSPITSNLVAAFPSGKTSANVQATSIAIDAANANHACITLSGFTASTGIGHVYCTNDFGTTWTRSEGSGGASPLPDVPTLKVLIDKSNSTGNGILVGTDTGLYASTDGGATWGNFNKGVIPAVPVFDLAQNDQYTIVAGTHGRGIFRLAPPVLFRDVIAPPGVGNPSEEEGGNLYVRYPVKTKLGDTVVAMIASGGCYGEGALNFSSEWNLIRGSASSQSSNSSGDCVTSWVVSREITATHPVPPGGHDVFTITG